MFLKKYIGAADAIDMHRLLARWNHIYIEKGTPADGPDMLPTVIDMENKGTLLHQIVSMPKAEPISFEDAVKHVELKWSAGFDNQNSGYNPGGGGWYTRNFVGYISSLGFHIELSGDEFEVPYGSKADN